MWRVSPKGDHCCQLIINNNDDNNKQTTSKKIIMIAIPSSNSPFCQTRKKLIETLFLATSSPSQNCKICKSLFTIRTNLKGIFSGIFTKLFCKLHPEESFDEWWHFKLDLVSQGLFF